MEDGFEKAGHSGVVKTLESLMRHFNWMAYQILDWTWQCQICKEFKISNGRMPVSIGNEVANRQSQTMLGSS